MNEIGFLKKLDAASPPAPPIDVSARVLQTLQNPLRIRPTPRLSAPPSLWLATGLSWAAAAAALFLAIQSLTQLQDPFSDLFNPLTMVLR